jgi:hypothetical protein
MDISIDYTHKNDKSKDVLIPADMSALIAEFRMILQESGVRGEDLEEAVADFIKFIEKQKSDKGIIPITLGEGLTEEDKKFVDNMPPGFLID